MSTPPPPGHEPDQPQQRQEGAEPQGSPPLDGAAPDAPTPDADAPEPTPTESTPPTAPDTPHQATAEPPRGTPEHDIPPPQGHPQEGNPPPQGQPRGGPPPQGYPSGSYLRSGGAEGGPTPGGYPPGYQPSGAPEGYPPSGPPPGYPQGDYSQGGFSQPTYPPAGYAQGGYPPSYPPGNYPPGAYPQGAQGGYPQGGYQGYPGYPGYPDGGAATPPPDDPLVPGDFSSWFQKIIGVVQRSWRQLAIFQLVIAVLTAIYLAVTVNVTARMAEYGDALSAGQTLPPADGMAAFGIFSVVLLAGMVVLGLISALIYPATFFVVIRDAAGHPASLGDALRFGGSRLLATVGWGILSGLITLVGFILLIIPGLYLSIVFGASLLGVIVVERGSIGRCFTLVNARFWPTTGRLVILWLIYLVYYGITHAIGSAFGGPLSVTPGIVEALLTIPIGIFLTGALVVTYAELRFREHPGVTTQALDAEMTGRP